MVETPLANKLRDWTWSRESSSIPAETISALRTMADQIGGLEIAARAAAECQGSGDEAVEAALQTLQGAIDRC